MQNLEHFYHTLLHINHSSLCVKLTMREGSDYVFACHERDIDGMDYREFYTCVADLEWWADELDDRLQNLFPPEPQATSNSNLPPSSTPPQH